MRPIVPVVLAGGSGTRLWPLSRDLYPKQLIPLPADQTMLQSTLLRLSGFPGLVAPIVIGNEQTRFMTAEQLRAAGIFPEAIILEPIGRNTAPAVAVAALKALSMHPEAILLVLPADHYIEHPARFQTALKAAVPYAGNRYLITFGIVPTAPETGYGYIRKGPPLASPDALEATAFAIDRFVEKPDLRTAEQYLASGEYFWNSGMFMFRADIVLTELEKFAPEMVAACQKAMAAGKGDADFFRLDRDSFAACPGNSIDYAVMEKTERGAMIPMDAGWNDLGSWEALFQVGVKDKCNNVRKGDTLVHDVKNCYLHATSRLVSAVGLSDHVVVETADAVLISPRHRVQDVKALVDQLKSARRTETSTHGKTCHSWGSSERILTSPLFEAVHRVVKPGASVSCDDLTAGIHWIVIRGSALVTRGDEQLFLKKDGSAHIPSGIAHGVENPGETDLELLEIRTGGYPG